MSVAVLAWGQSNMEGAYGPSPSSGVYSPTIRAWSLASNAFETATLGASPFRIGSPTPNNLAFVFCKELARHIETAVDLVLIAAGGMKIEHFMPNTVLSANGWTNSQTSIFGASAADELMGTGGVALNALGSLGKSAFDVVIMHQGEANVDSASVYLAKLEAQYAEMANRGLLTLGQTPIVMGYINPSYSNAADHGAAVASFVSAHSKCGSVPWSGIQTVGGGNNHATGLGLEQLGVRYFNAFSAL